MQKVTHPPEPPLEELLDREREPAQKRSGTDERARIASVVTGR